MHHPLQALMTARDVEQRRRDAAWAALVAAERRLAHTVSQGQALFSYRQETQARYRSGSVGLQGAEQVHTVHGFGLRLDDALRQQIALSHQAQGQRQQCRTQLVEADRRLKVLDKLIEKRQLALRLQTQRREQRADDERANTMVARPALTASGTAPYRSHHTELEDV